MKESIVSNSLYEFTFSFTIIKFLHCLLSEDRRAFTTHSLNVLFLLASTY